MRPTSAIVFGWVRRPEEISIEVFPKKKEEENGKNWFEGVRTSESQRRNEKLLLNCALRQNGNDGDNIYGLLQMVLELFGLNN